VGVPLQPAVGVAVPFAYLRFLGLQWSHPHIYYFIATIWGKLGGKRNLSVKWFRKKLPWMVP